MGEVERWDHTRPVQVMEALEKGRQAGAAGGDWARRQNTGKREDCARAEFDD